MIIGVTGDTHNNLKNIKKICSIFNENRAELVFHTGDISLPKSLLAFRDLNCPLKAVFGNNDIGEREGLIDASKKGFKSYVLFLVQIENMKYFKIAKDIDKDYYENYLMAKKSGVKFLAYKCKIDPKKIKIDKKIKIIDE